MESWVGCSIRTTDSLTIELSQGPNRLVVLPSDDAAESCVAAIRTAEKHIKEQRSLESRWRNELEIVLQSVIVTATHPNLGSHDEWIVRLDVRNDSHTDAVILHESVLTAVADELHGVAQFVNFSRWNQTRQN
ncbi:hypothetical protein DTL21_16210 [Bremerella cremea]|uniref:Uncharacterized protein n=1 Tax=Blastopirellula marina TaxID=124 RepID=A0A2S8FS68_9BACT|nr:hypothetical protein C5Y83_16195 [Blastopirellula marina]RCS47516.1 hypothetical protein DTL21_16210 [Bremerella cremea]